MKKSVFAALVFLMMVSFCNGAFAQESSVLDSKRDFNSEAGIIKLAMQNSKDVILLSSLWDSCILTMNQIDAYVSLLGIFNTIKKEDTTLDSLKYLENWISQMKSTGDLNIKLLTGIIPIEPLSNNYIQKLKAFYTDLNKTLDGELAKVTAIKRTVKVKPGR
jgi:hypothetical protein